MPWCTANGDTNMCGSGEDCNSVVDASTIACSSVLSRTQEEEDEQAKEKEEKMEQQLEEALTLAAAFMKTLSQGVIKGKDDTKIIQQRKDRKRQVNRASAKRKRMKDKQKLDDIAAQCKHLEAFNQQLKADNMRLSEVIREETLKYGMYVSSIDKIRTSISIDKASSTAPDEILREDDKNIALDERHDTQLSNQSTDVDVSTAIAPLVDPLKMSESETFNASMLQTIIGSFISSNPLRQEYVHTPQVQQTEELKQQHNIFSIPNSFTSGNTRY